MASSQKLGAAPSEALHKILSWHLPDLPSQFQFKQCCEDFGGRKLRFQPIDQFVDVRRLIRFQQRQNALFVRSDFAVCK